MKLNKKNRFKRILSIVLVISITITSTLLGIYSKESAKADSFEKISLELGWADASFKLIQVKTNVLSSDVVGKSFTSYDNQCSIDETGSTQNVGWFGMDDVDGKYTITLHYNNDISAGDKFVLNKGSVFGFISKSDENTIVKYELDKTYTIVYDGTSFSLATQLAEPTELTMSYKGYGTSKLIQYITDLPTDIAKSADFLATDNDCDLNQSGNQQLGYASTLLVDEKVIITFNFNSEFEVGQSYTIGKDSIFGFSNTDVKYKLKEDVTLYFNGEGWQSEPIVEKSKISLECTGGSAKLIKFSTNLPTDTPCVNFLSGDNGSDLKQDDINKYQQVGWIGMSEVTEKIILEFNFSNDFLAGQTYVLPKGAIFGFTNGKTYELDKDYTFWYDGYKWTVVTNEDNTENIVINNEKKQVVAHTSLNEGFTLDSLVQFTGFYDFGVTSDDTPLAFVGTIYVNGVEINNPTVVGYHNNTIICFKNLNLNGNTLTIMAGSIIYYGDKAVIIDNTFHKKRDSDVWTDGKISSGNQIIILGDADANLKVDLRDLVNLKKAELTSSVTEFNDLITDNIIDKWDSKCMRKILAGVVVDVTQDSPNSVENLLAESNFTGGDDFITFADRPADPTNVEKINEYKALGFNTSLVTGEYGHYLSDYIKEDISEATYELQNGEKELTFNVTYFGTNLIQIKTNISTDIVDSKMDFTENDSSSGHTLLFEKSSNASKVSWFEFGIPQGAAAVYLTPHFSGSNSRGVSYTFRAGTKLNVNGTIYALTKTYIYTYSNDYKTSIENLDNAGLNVWIRNTNNLSSYLTEEYANLIKSYIDVIDGIYINDEPFETSELKQCSDEKNENVEQTVDFSTLGGDMATWFNTNLSNKYFHVNHVPIRSYNHYGEVGLKDIDCKAYGSFFDNYQSLVLDNITTSDTKKTIGFDNYPFGYNKSTKFLWTSYEEFVTEGIDPTYLANLLIPADNARKNNNTFSVCIQTMDKTSGNKTRTVDSKEEITMQLYSAMACGASMFEYFMYNSDSTINGIIDVNGEKRKLYDATKQANVEALPFSNIINTFEWKGAEIIKGSTSKNSDAIKTVTDSGLNLLLDDLADGVLSGTSAGYDALVGYYKKDGYDGYMLANFNDPKQVTSNNSVTMKFEGCNYARIYTSENGTFETKTIELSDGSYTFTLKPGSGCFVIPVKAAI